MQFLQFHFQKKKFNIHSFHWLKRAMNRLFIFNIDRVISFLRLGSKHFLPDFGLKWPWNHIGWMNRCWDIWPVKYVRTVESASFDIFFVKFKFHNSERIFLQCSWVMGNFQSVFRGLFRCGIYILNNQASKNFDSMVKSLYAEKLSWDISKIVILLKCPRCSFVPIVRHLPYLAQLYW